MKHKNILIAVGIAVSLTIVSAIVLSANQDKYAVKVPNGLGFSDFKGYESWQLIAVSLSGDKLVAVLGDPATVAAFKAGVPDNGKPFPDGARMAKIHWNSKKSEWEPGQPILPDTQHDMDFMLKDSKRFADSGGWGYAAFEFDPASNTFRPADLSDKPPQAHDAKCGYACHTKVEKRDYVFTRYAAR